MRLGTKVVRQSPRLQNRGVEDGECSRRTRSMKKKEDGECSRRTRSMKKKGRALSQDRLNFGKRPRSSVNLSEAIGSKSDSDSDFDCMYGKGKAEVVEVDARIQLSSRFLKIWDFYYDENTRNFHGKATYWNDYTVPEKIINKLTGPQFQLFIGIMGKSGNSDVSGYSGKESVLVAKYFGESRVTRAFIKSVYEEASFDNDEEAVTIGDLNVFPWGKIYFDQTVRSLSIAVKGSARRLKSGFIEYNIFKERYTKLYKLCGFPYCFQVFLYETIPTLKDRGFCVRKDVSKFRILGWKEIGKSPTNEQLNDFVFGSGQMRVQLMKPSLEESCEMSFLDGFRFLEVNDGGFGVDNNNDPNGKIMFSGSSVSREDIKIMLDERLKPLGDSTIIKQIKDLLRVVCPDKCSDVNNSERDKLCDEVPLENACLDCLVCGGKYKSCDHGPVNVTHSCELNESHTCDAVGKDFSDLNVEKLSKVTESENEPTVIVKESFSVARDLEGKKQSDVVSNVISGVVRGRNFLVLNFLVRNRYLVDCEKSLHIVGEGNANVENEEQESSPNSKSHFDDIIFTTQDIKMIEEMEHSVTKEDVVSKRAAVKSAVLRSPYTTDFGSADCKELVLYPKDIRKGISAFPDECMKFPDVSEVLLFDEWFKIGFNSRKRVYKFPGSSDNINPPFSFGDIRISSKMWFYSLLTPNKWINDDHINIAFYYLRKLARHSPKVRVKVTTVDSWFHVKITSLYKEYIMKCFHKYVLREEMDIREYVLGYSMCINTPWAEVDYVLFPINMDKPGHWFLLIFDIRRRALVLYNTLEQSSVVMKSKLKEVCEPYVFALPIILSGCGFWKSRNDIDRTSSSFTKYGLDDPLELEVAKAVPEQVE
ncbi:hypothetical protein OROMI_015267 [Orobanche minor]